MYDFSRGKSYIVISVYDCVLRKLFIQYMHSHVCFETVLRKNMRAAHIFIKHTVYSMYIHIYAFTCVHHCLNCLYICVLSISIFFVFRYPFFSHVNTWRIFCVEGRTTKPLPRLGTRIFFSQTSVSVVTSPKSAHFGNIV